MKKLFTLAAALMASFSLWAATESNPTSDITKDVDLVGTSYTLPGTYIAGQGGTKAGDMQTKGVKFRLNKTVGEIANAVEFKVNEGYVISQIDFCGHVNDNSKTSTITDVKVDGVSINFTPVNLPTKTSSTSFSISGIEALESIVMVFQGDGTQANIEYTITYDEAVQKEIKSTLVELTAVAINGEALEASQVASLKENKTLALGAEYVTAPTVTFTATTTVTYVDDTQKITDQDIEVVAEEVEGKWQAQTIINVNTYTVTAVKPATFTVNYYNGETLLGTETVKAGEDAVLYLELQAQPLSEFVAWYTDKELTQEVQPLGGWTINADKNYYGKWNTAYAKSINIEQLVLDNGTKYDIKAELTKLGYAYENIDALDTLNDLDNKANRNYPYLGLKLKKADAYVSCNLKAGDSIAVLFGNIGEGGVKIGVNGQYETLPESTGTSIGRRAQTDEYLEIICPGTKTIVIKQIMINEDIKEVTLPAPSAYLITCAEAENGKVEATWENKKYRTPVGALVTLTVTPDEGYKVADVKVNGVSLNAVEGVYAFEMPAEDVTVTATFEANEPQTETYLVTVAAAENGSIEANWEGKGEDNKAAAGTLITLTVTPAEGYEIDQVMVNGTPLNAVEGVYAFTMPAEAVTVSATFKEIEGQGIDNTNVDGKAVKVIENGVLYLKYKGTMYDVQGNKIR